MISGQSRLEQAILGPLQPQKLPKMANFGCFSLFNAWLTIVLAGSKWNSPIKVKTEVMSGLIPGKKVILGPHGLQKDQKWPILAVSAHLVC